MGFATYEALTVAYRRGLQRPPTPSERGTLAGCAAFCVLSACMPLEVVMRRLQARPCLEGPAPARCLGCMVMWAAVRGLRARPCLSARARHGGRAPWLHAAGGWAVECGRA